MFYLDDVIAEHVAHQRQCMRREFLVNGVCFLQCGLRQLLLNETAPCLVKTERKQMASNILKRRISEIRGTRNRVL